MYLKFTAFSLFILKSVSLLCQEGIHINYTVDDGLPSNMVYCVQQDEDGFIWFGTDSGLSKYDGYEFTNYTINDGLPDTEILNFFKDSHNRIWFYTLNGKVGFLENGVIYSSRNTDWLIPLDSKSRITSIVEKNNKIFFSFVKSRIKVLNSLKTIQVDIQEWSFEKSVCICNNELLVFSLSGIQKINDDYTTEWKIRYADRIISYPLCYNKNVFGFDRNTTSHGVIKLEGDSIINSYHSASNYILNLEEQNNQLYLFKRENVSILTNEKQLEFSNYSDSYKLVSSMLIDREGNSWFTSIAKGVYFQPSTDIERVLNIKYVTALEKSNDQLLFAHDKRFISKLDRDGKQSNHKVFDDFNQVNLIYCDRSENIWIVRNNGVFRNDKRLIKGTGGFSLLTFDSTYFLTGRSRALLGNSATGKSLTTYNLTSYGLSSLLIGKDSILIGTDNGLILLNDNKISQFSPHLLLKSRITKLAHDKEGNLWIGTGGNGLLQYKNDHLSQITTDDGLASNIVQEMLMGDSIIWVSTPKGINKVHKAKSEQNIQLLDASDGLRSYKINDMELYNGHIYLGINDGLYAFPVNLNLEESSDFKLYFDRILVNNNEVGRDILKTTIKDIQLNFKALSFRNHNSLQYQYKLINNNSLFEHNNWLDIDNNRVNFSELAPARYTFYVRAKTKNSQWTQPISYNFEIIPAFWQTIWFQFIIILLIISSIVGLIHYQNSKRLARKNLEKEKLVAELKALKAQINPHFLFNVLNSIQSFILENEKDIALEYLVKYGRLMRIVLEHSDHLMVSLKSEMEMLNLYTDLEKLRLKYGFDFEIVLSDYYRKNNLEIPSMIIQPFVENAIWHGLSPLRKEGKIIIKIGRMKDYTEIRIIDNGVGFSKENSKSNSHLSSGIRLVNERLGLLPSKDSNRNKIEVESEIGHGTTIIITFADTLIK